MIKDFPREEQPREKVRQKGIDCVTNIELLALLLRTGNKEESVMQLAQSVLHKIGGFHNLSHITYHELIKIKGIKQSKAIALLAGVEIAKRLSYETKRCLCANNARDVYQAINHQFRFEKQEKVMILCLNNRLEIVKEKIIFIGSAELSIVSSKEIFREVFITSCNRFILIHNHPSGNPEPSKEDKEITKRLEEMAKQLEIELVDHLIIGDNCFYSFALHKVVTGND